MDVHGVVRRTTAPLEPARRVWSALHHPVRQAREPGLRLLELAGELQQPRLVAEPAHAGAPASRAQLPPAALFFAAPDLATRAFAARGLGLVALTAKRACGRMR